MSAKNRQFEFRNLVATHAYDPGVIRNGDHLYLTDMTRAFAEQGGGLYVYDPKNPQLLHPDMASVIAANMKMLDLFLEAERYLGHQPPVDASEDAHRPHHPSHPNAYRDQTPFRTITRAMLDDLNDSDLNMPGLTLSGFKRHLDMVPEHTMHVYTVHGLLGTPDARLIANLRNHPAKKRITPKGHAKSKTTKFVSEQFALGMLDTRESTGWVEYWALDGVARQFITGLCSDICCSWQAFATRTLSDIEVVMFVDAMIPLGVALSPYDSTQTELDQLGLDKNEWLAINPGSKDPLTLEQFWGAKLLNLGVKFTTVERLFQNMKPYILN